MPEWGTSGSVGALGGKPPGATRLRHTYSSDGFTPPRQFQPHRIACRDLDEPVRECEASRVEPVDLPHGHLDPSSGTTE